MGTSSCVACQALLEHFSLLLDAGKGVCAVGQHSTRDVEGKRVDGVLLAGRPVTRVRSQREVEEVAEENLPADYDVEFTGLSKEEANERIQTFLNDIGLEANDTLKQYKADPTYLCYGFKKGFGVLLPEKEPFFVLPISSVAHLNTEALRYALGDFVKNVTEEKEG